MRRQSHSEIEFIAPFSLEECRLRLLNLPKRYDASDHSGFEPSFSRETETHYAFRIRRLRYQHSGTQVWAEMRGTLRVLSDYETQVSARIYVSRFYSLLVVFVTAFMLVVVAPLVLRMPCMTLFLLYATFIMTQLMLVPLRDKQALVGLATALFSQAVSDQKPLSRQGRSTATSSVRPARQGLPLAPRLHLVAPLPLEQCHSQLLYRDYSMLEIRGPQVAQPQFDRIDENGYRFVMRRMHYGYSLTTDTSKQGYSCVRMQGELRALNDRETAVDAQVRINLNYGCFFVVSCIAGLIGVGMISSVLAGSESICLTPFALPFLYSALRNLSIPIRDYNALVKHLNTSLDPARFVSPAEKFGSG